MGKDVKHTISEDEVLTSSVKEVEAFLSSNVWKDFERDALENREMWKENLVAGVELSGYTDDRIRGIIEAIDYLLDMPRFLVEMIELKAGEKETEHADTD